MSEIVIHLRLAVLLGGVLLLAACGPAAAPLEGTEWVLVSLQGSSPLAGSHIWPASKDEQVRGYAGCNQYGGPYAVTGMDLLTYQELAITEQACLEPEGVMEQKTVYMAALRTAVAYRLAGDRLDIQDSAGEMVLAFDRWPVYPGDPAGLVSTAWRLIWPSSATSTRAAEGQTGIT